MFWSRETDVTVSTDPVEAFEPSTGGFMIATDGTRDSDGAVRVGLALARRDNVRADMLIVVDPLPITDLDGVPRPDTESLLHITRESTVAALLAQRDRTHPGIREWPFDIDVGPRVEAIVANAERRNASLILLGLGAHGLGARLMQRETALRVIRASPMPVLALPSHAWGVPHSAVAALDFTASSEDAARAALALLGGEGTLYLAHVTPRVPIPQGDSRTWDEITSSAVLPTLDAVARRLAPPSGVQIEYVSLQGDPAHELLAFAEQRRIDMVAAGAHGRSALSRLVLGSVSTTLVRSARCWVLVAPPRPDTSPAAGADVPNDWT
jgi:nucleotide-binding universal stress UspA family protein